ncbi:MAG: DUF1501 domain-containing protein [Rubripirellula sp.]
MTKSTRTNNKTERRSILKAAALGCGAMSTHVSVMSTLMNLQATKAVMADQGATDYKALVCLFLLGGNDSYNMLIPRNSAAAANPNEYDDYASARGGVDDMLGNSNSNTGGLALAEADLLAINDPTNLSGRSFGLHPGMGVDATGNQGLNGGVAKLYNDGNLAFMANIGSLVEPTTRAEYNNRSNLPLGLFSHADLQRHWMTGAPHTRSQITGWGGRLSDLFQGTNQNPAVSMNISLSGANIYQSGQDVFPYAIGTGGATQVSYYQTNNLQNRMFKKQMDSMLAQTYSDLLAKSFADTHRLSLDAAVEFNNQVNAVNLTTVFDQGDTLSRQMEKIAQVIAAAPQLQQTRQVFFVTIGGWDNHTNLLPAQDTNLPRVSRALKSFYDATVELGCQDDVVTFTASDFARTLGTNGQGSDHAWGGNHIVMGGGIDGGKIYGEFPESVAPGQASHSVFGNLDLGRGRMIPTTSVDEMAAELAMWFGVNSAANLEVILPNIGSFYQYNAGSPPIGFFT